MSNKVKILFIVFMSILLLAVFNTKVFAEESKFTLDKESIDVPLNGNGYLSYSGWSGTVTWKSNDTSVATVEDGKVTGKKIGTTTITATSGSQTATCKVNVVYCSLNIRGNEGVVYSGINLILEEHPTENLTAIVEDYNANKISNPNVKWSSSNSSIVSVDDSGKLTALKIGKATITATATGVSNTCEVNVLAAPGFTDFSNAKYETTIQFSDEELKITGITPKEEHSYYYIITSTKEKPKIAMEDDRIDTDALDRLAAYSDEKYLETDIAKYAELNQDMYIWIVEEMYLEDSYYYNESGESVHYANKFVVEGKKITRAELPKDLIPQHCKLGHWDIYNADYELVKNEKGADILFCFPTKTEKRKFTLKIGKVTDKTILKKIQNDDYSGITELLSYAKSHEAIYSKKLTTTSVGVFDSEELLFDGRSLLEDGEYYFVYAKFDDENGKYYPIEGVNFGQAIYESDNKWELFAYTDPGFKWDNLYSKSEQPEKKDSKEETKKEETKKENNTKEETKKEENKKENNQKDENKKEKEKDNTIAPGVLPQTGLEIIIFACISIIMLVCGTYTYIKYRELKQDIK